MHSKIVISGLVGTLLMASASVAFASGGSSTGGGTNSGGSTTSSTAPCNSVTKYKLSTGDNLDGTASVRASISLANPCTTGTGLISVSVTNDSTGQSVVVWRGWFVRDYSFSARYDAARYGTSYTVSVVADGTTTKLPSIMTPTPLI